MRIRRNKKGFTLVELIVVIAILAVLAAVATVSVTAIVNNAKVKAMEGDLNQYKSAYNAWVNGGEEGTFQNFVEGANAIYKIELSEGTTKTFTTTGTGATAKVTVVTLKKGGYTGTYTLASGKVEVKKD